MTALAWMPIPLSQNLYALVDGEDHEELSKHKWYADKGHNTYYARRQTLIQNGKHQTVRMHRLIMNAPIDMEIDHRNGCGLDNRKANLRPATHQQNHFNQRFQRGKKSSRYKGVALHKHSKKWLAKIQSNNKQTHLGCFENEKDAALAYNQAAIKYFGEFARLNNV